MTTPAFRNLGEQFRDNSGNILTAGSVYYYQSGTGILQATYSDSGLTTPNSNPLLLDSDGRLDTAVFLGSTNDYKEIVKDSSGATVSPWPFDNIPKGDAIITDSSYALPLIDWVAVTSASSPVSPAASDAGNGYLCNTSGGSITFNLPSASTVGSGKGFVFKKVTATNSVTVTPNGAETIDGAASLSLTGIYYEYGIVSDGTNWQITSRMRGAQPTVQTFTSGSGTYTPAAGTVYIRVRMCGGGGGGGAALTNAGTTGGTTTFGSWTAIGGSGGTQGTAAVVHGGAGGTGGADGTGTKIIRNPGNIGTWGSTTLSGFGAPGPWGGGADFRLTTGAGIAGSGYGSGGSGGMSTASTSGGGGGGSGERLEFYVNAPGATSYAVGALGAGGTAGTQAGGDGVVGIINIEEFYS